MCDQVIPKHLELFSKYNASCNMVLMFRLCQNTDFKNKFG